jgi:hypothetical protein
MLYAHNTQKEIAKHDVFFNTIDLLTSPNRGGCLMIAYTFYLYLIKNNLPTDTFRIKQYQNNHGDDDIDHNIKFINGLTDSAVSSAHYTWLYNGVEMDGTIRKHKELAVVTDTYIILPIKDFTLFCENALINGNWNWIFNRDESIKIIKEHLDIDLTHLD